MYIHTHIQNYMTQFFTRAKFDHDQACMRWLQSHKFHQLSLRMQINPVYS